MSGLAEHYRGMDSEKQRKIEELAGIREAYRNQRRIWLWMICLAVVSSSILMGRSSKITLLFAFVCLGIGLFVTWNFWKCTRAIRMIDKGLIPYRVQEKGARKGGTS